MKQKRSAPIDTTKRLLESKRKLVKRLREDIVTVRWSAKQDIEKIERRIRIAGALISALEKGTLKA